MKVRCEWSNRGFVSLSSSSRGFTFVMEPMLFGTLCIEKTASLPSFPYEDAPDHERLFLPTLCSVRVHPLLQALWPRPHLLCSFCGDLRSRIHKLLQANASLLPNFSPFIAPVRTDNLSHRDEVWQVVEGSVRRATHCPSAEYLDY